MLGFHLLQILGSVAVVSLVAQAESGHPAVARGFPMGGEGVGLGQNLAPIEVDLS